MPKWLISRRALFISFILGLLNNLPVFAAQLPTFKLTRQPTDSSAQFSISTSVSGSAYFEYGLKPGSYTSKTSKFDIKKGIKNYASISNLKSNSKYYVRLRYLFSGKTYNATSAIEINTRFSNGSAKFAIQADPHMDENSSADVYNKTLDLIANSGSSFLIDLGDIFMVDKLLDKSEENIRARFELMKSFYSRLKGMPLKIVLGNHDGELGYSKFNTKKYRAEFFPDQTSAFSYFAFSESDVLHIGLDPFTYTTVNPKSDGWQWTLGKTQYDWLVKTLETSTESHKFIYVHHLLVGDAQSRGGARIAAFNEWGGKNMDGSDGFEKMRPGWGKPIHQLLKENDVSIVFKGHDHIYVKENYDGIIYQTLPQPSHPGDGTNSAVEYGYGEGKVVGGSGYLQVETSARQVKVDFIKFDGSVADSYIL